MAVFDASGLSVNHDESQGTQRYQIANADDGHPNTTLIWATLLTLVAAIPLPAPGQHQFGMALDQKGFESASTSVAQWRAENKPEPEIQKLYQSALAACNGADAAVASLVGTANIDYARLGRMLIAGSLAPDAYLARVRDRSRKLRKARGSGLGVRLRKGR